MLIEKDAESGLVEKTTFDEADGRMVVETIYDSSAVLDANKADQNESPGIGRYMGKDRLIHVGRLHKGDVVRLKNIGYDVLAADPAEVRRALLYIQGNEPHLLTVPGKPFSKVRPKWV